MNAKPWSVLLLCGLALSISCKKSSDSGQKTKTQLLTQSTWRYDRSGMDLDNNGTIDAPLPPGTLQSCDTDGTVTFKSDGTGIADEGPTKCNASNPQTSTFNWNLKDNESTINISGVVFGGLSGDIKLLSVTDTELSLEKDITNAGYTAHVIVFLKH